ncbi:MAG: putative lipid II flippase FtsW [Proteobacteria bacterium]|nr:putative lipid II flippase FtsW [Pseudomonadota bacterium]
MIGPARTDTSIVGSWWWTVDRLSLAAVAVLMAAGMILVIAASPPVAERLGYGAFHFVARQASFLAPAILVLATVSMLRPDNVRRLAAVAFVVSLVLVAATIPFGEEVNGARRWLGIAGIWFQPSELLKPAFAVVSAWILAVQQRSADASVRWVSMLVLAVVIGLLVMQPDIGMAALIVAAWTIQFFVAGVPLRWVAAAAAAGAAAAMLAYAFVPHVTARVDGFLFPVPGENYQVETALNAFHAGGPFGRGPGEGVVKNVLPDAHTDFIFAVAGEEFGLLACLAIAAAFAFVVLRAIVRLMRETDYFVLLAGTGLVVQFGLQAAINMGVNLRMLPAKGMTLPFLSYGGSSLLALALAMGMLLALTRRRTSALEARWILGRATP